MFYARLPIDMIDIQTLFGSAYWDCRLENSNFIKSSFYGAGRRFLAHHHCSAVFSLCPNNRLLIFNLMKRSQHMDLLTFNPSFQFRDPQICKNHRDLTNSMKILCSYPGISFNRKLIICLHSNCPVKFDSFKSRMDRGCHSSFSRRRFIWRASWKYQLSKYRRGDLNGIKWTPRVTWESILRVKTWQVFIRYELTRWRGIEWHRHPLERD